MLRNADALVELDKVGARAKQNMLAVIDDFAGARVLVGGSASAEEWTLFENGDAEAGIGEGAGGGESGEVPPAMATVGCVGVDGIRWGDYRLAKRWAFYR